MKRAGKIIFGLAAVAALFASAKAPVVNAQAPAQKRNIVFILMDNVGWGAFGTHEDNNLFYTDLTNGWMLAPDFKIIGEYQQSVQKYPNIKVGEDFKGYAK